MRRELSRQRRHRRIRKRVSGMPQKPRMAVFRSQKHIYAQLIDDIEGKTLLSCSTNSKSVKKDLKSGASVSSADKLGKLIASEALKLGIKNIVFDRGGYRYHGRIKALAEAARQGGLVF